MEIFPWRFILEIFPLQFSKKFNEDLFIGDFSFDDVKIFNEDLLIGDFSLRFFLLKICSWRFFFLKICSWRFFLEDLFWRLNFWKNFDEDLFMEIFPWRFILRDFSIEVLEIFTEDFFIGDLLFWRFFLWKMENFPFENGDFLWSQSEEDEVGQEMMKIYSWGKNDDDLKKKKTRLWMGITLVGSWCRLLDKSLLNSQCP